MCWEATITKRAVAWVGSVQPECTVPLSTWSFRNFKPEFLLNGKRPKSMHRLTQPRSQGSLLPALRSVGRVGENPGNEVGTYCVETLLEGINSHVKCLIQKHHDVIIRTFYAQKELKKKYASVLFWLSMLVHKKTDKTNCIDHRVRPSSYTVLSVVGNVDNHIAAWTPFTDKTSKIDWDSVTCVMHSRDYY